MKKFMSFKYIINSAFTFIIFAIIVALLSDCAYLDQIFDSLYCSINGKVLK